MENFVKVMGCVMLVLIGIGVLLWGVACVISSTRAPLEKQPEYVVLDRDGVPLNPQPKIVPQPQQPALPALPRRPQGSLDTGSSGSLGDLKGAKEPAKK